MTIQAALADLVANTGLFDEQTTSRALETILRHISSFDSVWVWRPPAQVLNGLLAADFRIESKGNDLVHLLWQSCSTSIELDIPDDSDVKLVEIFSGWGGAMVEDAAEARTVDASQTTTILIDRAPCPAFWVRPIARGPRAPSIYYEGADAKGSLSKSMLRSQQPRARPRVGAD